MDAAILGVGSGGGQSGGRILFGGVVGRAVGGKTAGILGGDGFSFLEAGGGGDDSGQGGGNIGFLRRLGGRTGFGFGRVLSAVGSLVSAGMVGFLTVVGGGVFVAIVGVVGGTLGLFGGAGRAIVLGCAIGSRPVIRTLVAAGSLRRMTAGFAVVVAMGVVAAAGLGMVVALRNLVIVRVVVTVGALVVEILARLLGFGHSGNAALLGNGIEPGVEVGAEAVHQVAEAAGERRQGRGPVGLVP